MSAAALAVGTVGCGGSSSSSTATGPKRATPVAVTTGQLKAIAKNAGHPLYWIGPSSGVTYELTTIADGRTYLRYLPAGVPVGTPQHYLTIGTYTEPVVALPAVRQAAAKRHALTRSLPGGVLAVQYPTHRQSVYLAFPGAHYLVEVYDPSPAKALRLATSGKVIPIS